MLVALAALLFKDKNSWLKGQAGSFKRGDPGWRGTPSGVFCINFQLVQEGLFQNLSSPGQGGVSTALFLCKIAIYRAVVKLLHERDDCGDDRHGLRRDDARHPFDGFGLGLLYLKANAVYFLQQP